MRLAEFDFMVLQQVYFHSSLKTRYAVFQVLGVCLLLGLAARSPAQLPSSRPSADSTGNSTTQPAERPTATTRISPELLQRVQRDLGKVKTVEADFVQEKHLAVLDHVLMISGHFAIQKPDRLIWIVREPVRYAIRIEGEEVRQWDQDTKRVDVIHLGGDPTFKAVSDQIRAWFLGDYEELAGNYDVNVLSENPLSLAFIPKAATMVAKVLEQVQVTFAPDLQYVDKMVIDEVGGDRTSVEFIHTQVNRPIAQDVWRIPPNEH
jgi:outer membrane lipoprotein-sorting protein